MTNFSFLLEMPLFAEFTPACIDAEKSLAISYSTSAVQSRRALELAVKWVYSYDSDLTVPYQDNLSALIHDYKFKSVLDSKIFPRIRFIIDLGNKAAHTARPVSRKQAIESLHCLYDFISWINYSYSQELHDAPFDENILPDGEALESKSVKMQQELEALQAKLAEKDKKLEELLKSSETRQEFRDKREENRSKREFNADDICEFKTRKLYIDLALEIAGWRNGSNWLEEIEVSGMPNGAGLGYVDYVLYGENGKPIAVIEAKRTSVDPRAGKIQAKLYADCLEKQHGVRPFIFYSNGFTTWFWDDSHYPERQVSGFFTSTELSWFTQRNRDKKSLSGVSINDAI
jgi:type I restriction enzyme R subunit